MACTLKEANGVYVISVKYKRDQQADENILAALEDEDDPQSCFGETKITVTHDPGTKGECEWKCEVPDWSVKSQWKVIGLRRLRVTQEQFVRESTFRNNVLAQDKRCVISGEPTPEVLDAAHLRPVKEDGEDLVENGFILRTDIHRLYDRGMFLINPDGTITLNSSDLSEYYVELLCRSRVQPATLERVREALQERLKAPPVVFI